MGTICPQKGGLGAGTNTTLPVGIQEGGRTTLPFFGEVYPEDGQGALGIADESLRRWIGQHEINEGEREGLTTDEREELSRLRRENKTLR